MEARRMPVFSNFLVAASEASEMAWGMSSA